MVTLLTLTSTEPGGAQFEDQLTYQISVVNSGSSSIPQGTVELTCTNGGSVTDLATLILDEFGNTNFTTNATPLGTNTIQAVFTPSIGGGLSATGVITQLVTLPTPARGLLPGFSLVGTYSPEGDPTPLLATINFTITPDSSASGTPLLLTWNTINVISIQFIANNGVDPVFNSGLIASNLSSGSYEITLGFSVTTNILMLSETVGGGTLSATGAITIT